MQGFEQKLSEYAQLIIDLGINPQKGQSVWLQCPAKCHEFAALLAEKAYLSGVGEFVVDFTDDNISRLRYLYGDDSCFDYVPEYVAEKYRHWLSKKAAQLYVIAPDTDALKGIDPTRAQREQRVLGSNEAIQNHKSQRLSGGWQWSIAACVSPQWAKKVFPDLKEEVAQEKLWESIFATALVTGDGTAPEKWKKKTASGLKRVEELNEYNFKKLLYKNKLGTDLSVELVEDHHWAGMCLYTKEGLPFAPNIPTEEVYTAPRREGVNGRICATRPLVTPAGIIDEFTFVLRDGKIVEATAKQGQDILDTLLDVDEGARYFGEVALVPYASPISQQKLLYHTTLFDENASCHFAFGRAVPAVNSAVGLSPEEQVRLGLNYSIVHYDFMVGTKDLEIIGIDQNGKEIPVFIDGSFAF